MNSETAIRAEQLCKQFGTFKAVDDLTLEVKRGEVFGFLGPNGAGKTTSISMICGLLRPTSGKVFINEKDISHNSEFRVHVGVCQQENIYWPKLTCAEQLVFIAKMYGLNKTDAKKNANNLLDKLGLKEKANKWASTLSGGMKRRLNICLALVHDPSLVVFDEPEAGLDPQSRVLVRDFIKSVSNTKTVILTTHNMDEADRLSDRVAIIDSGKLLVLDTPHNLKSSIGEGDILEIQMPEKADENLLRTALASYCSFVKLSDGVLLLKSKNLVAHVPEIILALKAMNVGMGEIRLRENSLEDVFIHLTGRSLRQ